MVDLVKWILSDFWRFAGAFFLIGVTGNGIAEITRAYRFPPEIDDLAPPDSRRMRVPETKR